MSISTVSSLVSHLDAPIPEPFSGVFSPNMTLAESSRMYLDNKGSTRVGPYGADSMGPSMGATPSADVLNVVTCLKKDSGAASRGTSRPGTGTPARLSHFLILSSSVCKYLDMLSTAPCPFIRILSSLAS